MDMDIDIILQFGVLKFLTIEDCKSLVCINKRINKIVQQWIYNNAFIHYKYYNSKFLNIIISIDRKRISKNIDVNKHRFIFDKYQIYRQFVIHYMDERCAKYIYNKIIIKKWSPIAHIRKQLEDVYYKFRKIYNPIIDGKFVSFYDQKNNQHFNPN